MHIARVEIPRLLGTTDVCEGGVLHAGRKQSNVVGAASHSAEGLESGGILCQSCSRISLPRRVHRTKIFGLKSRVEPIKKGERTSEIASGYRPIWTLQFDVIESPVLVQTGSNRVVEEARSCRRPPAMRVTESSNLIDIDLISLIENGLAGSTSDTAILRQQPS